MTPNPRASQCGSGSAGTFVVSVVPTVGSYHPVAVPSAPVGAPGSVVTGLSWCLSPSALLSGITTGVHDRNALLLSALRPV